MTFLNQILNSLALIAAATYSLIMAIFSIPLFLIYRPLGQWCHHSFGRVLCMLFAIEVHWIGMENIPPSQGVILAPNHESLFDILVVASMPYDFSWISKSEVARIPFIGWSMKAMGCYFVKRNHSNHDLNIMREVEDGLKEGRSVVIFPEGTRTRTGDLLPFKKGAFRMAQNSGAPLIPVAITGTWQIAKPGEIPSRRGRRVTVRIGKPFKIPSDLEIPLAMMEFQGELIKLLAQDRGAGYGIVSKND